jgi:hypothetical protein
MTDCNLNKIFTAFPLLPFACLFMRAFESFREQQFIFEAAVSAVPDIFVVDVDSRLIGIWSVH